MIKTLSRIHCQQAATLHIRCLPNDFLASMGSEVLTVLYRIFVQLPLIYPYGWLVNNELKGILVGTNDTNSVFRVIFVRYWYALYIPVIKSILPNPLIIFKIIETFFYTKRSNSTTTAELLVICVAPEMQRKGIGSILVKRFKRDLHKANIAQFKVNTHHTAVNANRFYKALSGLPGSQFKHYGGVWQTYLFETK